MAGVDCSKFGILYLFGRTSACAKSCCEAEESGTLSRAYHTITATNLQISTEIDPRTDYAIRAIGQPPGLTVGDFNGDGKVDVIVVCSIGCSTNVSIFFGNGDGTLQASVPMNQNVGGFITAVSGDFNGDGKLDLLRGGGTIAALLGNGEGTFQAPAAYTVPQVGYLALGDFNNDGKPDIASAGFSGSGEVSILINKGDGTFKSPVNYSIAGDVQALAAADLNGDGNLDLVIPTGGTSAAISILLGNGDGTFRNSSGYTSNLLSIYCTSIDVADFNGDGKLDLALTNSEAPANAVAIVLGNGDGTFQNPPVLYSAGLLPAGVVSPEPDSPILGLFRCPQPRAAARVSHRPASLGSRREIFATHGFLMPRSITQRLAADRGWVCEKLSHHGTHGNTRKAGVAAN